MSFLPTHQRVLSLKEAYEKAYGQSPNVLHVGENLADRMVAECPGLDPVWEAWLDFASGKSDSFVWMGMQVVKADDPDKLSVGPALEIA